MLSDLKNFHVFYKYFFFEDDKFSKNLKVAIGLIFWCAMKIEFDPDKNR